MSKKAFIFPGQGSQYVGMGKDLFENSARARELFEIANSTLGFDISKIMFEGPEEKLKSTEITQPAILLQSAIIFDLLKDKNFDGAAGHSLGEFTALFATGSLSFEDAISLVRTRGSAMLKTADIKQGTMAAIIGLDELKLEESCEKAKEFGIVQCANYNAPGQIVISGEPQAVYKAMELAKAAGAKIAKELVVSGAFHSELMRPATETLSQKLNSVELANSTIPIYANVTAKSVQNKETIKELLLNQLTSPVRWTETIENMIADGFDEFVEIGPGKVLQGLVKRINKDVKISGLDKYSDIN